MEYVTSLYPGLVPVLPMHHSVDTRCPIYHQTLPLYPTTQWGLYLHTTTNNTANPSTFFFFYPSYEIYYRTNVGRIPLLPPPPQLQALCYPSFLCLFSSRTTPPPYNPPRFCNSHSINPHPHTSKYPPPPPPPLLQCPRSPFKRQTSYWIIATSLSYIKESPINFCRCVH